MSQQEITRCVKPYGQPIMKSPLVGSDKLFDKNGQQILFTHGEGYSVFDKNKNEYTDFVLGVGPVILGHSHEVFNAELSKALSRGLSFPGFGMIHSQVSEVFESVYLGYKVVSLFKTSSEAVSASMRCAMLETGRKKIIRCGFLGWHDAQLALSPGWHEKPGSEKRKQLRYTEGMRGVTNEEAVFNWIDGDLHSLKEILCADGSEIALFAIDVYQLAFISEHTMKEAISLCREYGIRILLDETKTAGRTNPGGYLANSDILGDYIVLGKAIGNGLPLAILLGKPDILSVYRESRIGGTHTKEVLSPLAAIMVKDIMEREGGYETLSDTGEKIILTLNSAFKEAEVSNLVRAKPLFCNTLFDLEFSDKVINNFKFRELLKTEFLSNRIILMQGHNSFISLAHCHLDLNDFFHSAYLAAKNWGRSL